MIEIKHLTKTFPTSDGSVEAVKDIDLVINDGDIYGIIGLSGAGKSTLVRCINYLETPTEGKIVFDGIDLGALKKKELLKVRRSMSMIFQNFNLLEQRTALKNVCYPLEISGTHRDEAKKRAIELLEIVGLADRAHMYPSQLSGGQKQRVAIARALATNPKVLLCDEATSALDPNTTKQILDLLKRINSEMGVTIIVITHEMRVVEQICNKVAVLNSGRVVEHGNVSEIFLAPKSETARDLILPKSDLREFDIPDNTIRIVFEGQSSDTPVISDMTLECNTHVNILGANTKNINGCAYGQMLIELPKDRESSEKVIDYLKNHQIKYEEVKKDE